MLVCRLASGPHVVLWFCCLKREQVQPTEIQANIKRAR
jgi:hypothetical protein